MTFDQRASALEFMRSIEVCHLATCSDGKPWLRVMSSAKIDDDFTVWFATFTGSMKVRQISDNPSVCISYWADSTDVYVYGDAEEVEDRGVLSALWRDTWKAYFPEGMDDPNYTIIKVSPTEVYFRDFKKGMMDPVDLLKD